MWRRGILGFLLVGVVVAGSLGTRYVPAQPLAGAKAPPPAAKQPVAGSKDGIKIAVSRVSAVTVFPNSALVMREVDVPDGKGAVELVVSPLPPQTIASSLYTEGTAGLKPLTTRHRARQLMEDTRADVRKLQDELQKLQADKERLESEIRAVQGNVQLLGKLENYTAATSADKGALDSDSAIALAKYVMENRVEKAKELVALQQQVKQNQEKIDFVSRKLNELSGGISHVEQDAVIVVDRGNGGGGKVRLNYLVEAASWQPKYKLHAGKTNKNKVQLEYLAAVVQQTGESWDNVEVTLSTAQPMLNATPPDLLVMHAGVVAPGANPTASLSDPAVTQRLRVLRTQAQQDFNNQRMVNACKLCDAAACLEQSFELLNPSALASRKDGEPATREGPSVTHHLRSRLSVPSRNEEQVMEVAQVELTPDFYYKAVPILTPHVYRLADLSHKSNVVLLPGEADVFVEGDFVGRMTLPMVASGERFSAGFGIDPQLQVRRQLVERSRDLHGGNQVLHYKFRLQVNSFKAEAVPVQLWDRLPHSDTDNLSVSLIKSSVDVSKDPSYRREQWTNHLLRWDLTVEPGMNGDKAMTVTYDFSMELDKQLNVGSFATADAAPSQPQVAAVNTPMANRIRANMAKLSPDDRRLAESQQFCAVIEGARLGSRGVPLKVMLKGQPVFVCCDGCEDQAKERPDAALANLQRIRARVNAAPK